MYLDIPNIHAVRESYEALKALVFSSSSNKWLSNLENTQWLAYISLILKVISLICVTLLVIKDIMHVPYIGSFTDSSLLGLSERECIGPL